MTVRGYTAGQLVRYHAWCRANPDGRVLLPGGQRGWDEMPVCQWMRWFHECLTAKINRGLAPAGKGSRAKRRAQALADRSATCRWCGQPTGRANKPFCDASCFRSFNS